MYEFKVGNTKIKVDDSMAAKTDAEVKAILDEAAAIVTSHLVNAAVKSQDTA